MTKQEYYNLLFCSTLDGTFPSMNKNCMYRFKEKKCAIGLLIPDDKYDTSLEFKTIKNSTVQKAVDLPIGMNIHQLCPCQELHDLNAFILLSSFRRVFLSGLNKLEFFNDVVKLKGIAENSTKPFNLRQV